MLVLPHTVISRAQSDEIKLESRPLSARPPPPSHSRSVSTRRHTAAATAPRTSTPRCSACQKYWLTHTACASVTCLGLGLGSGSGLGLGLGLGSGSGLGLGLGSGLGVGHERGEGARRLGRGRAEPAQEYGEEQWRQVAQEVGGKLEQPSVGHRTPERAAQRACERLSRVPAAARLKLLVRPVHAVAGWQLAARAGGPLQHRADPREQDVAPRGPEGGGVLVGAAALLAREQRLCQLSQLRPVEAAAHWAVAGCTSVTLRERALFNTSPTGRVRLVTPFTAALRSV
eukprot:scaffold119912_cov66-Phaeocystis_antarctica.AAC.1